MELLEQIGRQAKEAEPLLRTLSGEKKNQVLNQAAEDLVKHTDRILKANEKDMARGREKGMKAGLLDRLQLSPKRIEGMAEGLRQIAALPDPIGQVMEEHTPDVFWRERAGWGGVRGGNQYCDTCGRVPEGAF